MKKILYVLIAMVPIRVWACATGSPTEEFIWLMVPWIFAIGFVLGFIGLIYGILSRFYLKDDKRGNRYIKWSSIIIAFSLIAYLFFWIQSMTLCGSSEF
jgi:hypothetical protein